MDKRNLGQQIDQVTQSAVVDSTISPLMRKEAHELRVPCLEARNRSGDRRRRPLIAGIRNRLPSRHRGNPETPLSALEADIPQEHKA